MNRIFKRILANIITADTDKGNDESQKNDEKKPELKGDYYYNTREMVDKNKRLIQEGKKDKCRFFEYKGYKIFNPFKDETGKKDVDPKEYYGEHYENSDFNRIN